MKRVQIVTNRLQEGGGIESVVQDVSWAFKRLDWEIAVTTVFGKEDHCNPYVNHLVSLCPHGTNWEYLWRRGFWELVLSWHLRKTQKKYDLLLIAHARLLRVLRLLSDRPRPKRCAWIYGLEVWGKNAESSVPFLNRVDRVASISQFTADQVICEGLDTPVSIIPCSVDTSVFTPTQDTNRIRFYEVLISGRMSSKQRDKGHEVLFRSIRRTEDLLGHKIKVRVVGSGEDANRLMQVARDLRLSDRVEFTGRLPRSELIEAYQHCGVFCMPTPLDESDSGSWNGEGFGIVYIEAAACGRPVIASCEGGAPETIRHEETGLLVNPRSIHSISNAIATILSDKQIAEEMGRRGRNFVEQKYSRERFLERFAEFLSVF